MEKSKVYFTDFRTCVGVSLTEKLQRLIKKAGITDIDMDGKFVAIKMHFGELGNLSYLRPNYAKAVADVVKECGGKPFLTDCNTLYPGSRKNALEHLDCANINGFNTITTGFGGAIKNIGMGCGSRAGKMQQHNSGKPIVHDDLCRGCRRCAKECGSDAITYENGKAVINQDICKGCGRCIGACVFDAIENQNWNANEILGRKMAEYSQAVCDGRPTFHISLVRDISPNCDCHGENDAPILPDVGIFASFDPVALDQACVDACLHATPMPNSQLSDNLADPHWHHHHDNFLDSNPNVRWKETLEHAEKIGLGTREYELIQMK